MLIAGQVGSFFCIKKKKPKAKQNPEKAAVKYYDDRKKDENKTATNLKLRIMYNLYNNSNRDNENCQVLCCNCKVLCPCCFCLCCCCCMHYCCSSSFYFSSSPSYANSTYSSSCFFPLPPSPSPTTTTFTTTATPIKATRMMLLISSLMTV